MALLVLSGAQVTLCQLINILAFEAKEAFRSKPPN
jgi:hypothetical protein